MHADLALPNVVSVQLAAFPNELLAFDNEKEKRSSKTWMKDMAAESCIPSGTFLPGKGPIDPPKPEIMFCGSVRETSRLTNPVTGQPFSWARVRTLGGELDVVADPAAVTSQLVTRSSASFARRPHLSRSFSLRFLLVPCPSSDPFPGSKQP